MKIENILVSQPQPLSEKNPFNDLAAKHNVNLNFMPLITIERVSLKEFRAQRVEILDHDAVIFTSKTAIDHFFTLAAEARVVIPETMKYFCVTEVIALYLQKYIVYRKRKIFFGKSNFADLLEVLAKHKELNYFLPVCDQHKPEIPAALTRNNITHSVVVISLTQISDTHDVKLSDFQMVVLYAAAEVKALIENFDVVKSQIKIAAFGNAATRAIIESGLTVDLAVPTPKMPSMTMAIDKFINSLNAGEDLEQYAMREMPATPSVIEPTAKQKNAKGAMKIITPTATIAKSAKTSAKA